MSRATPTDPRRRTGRSRLAAVACGLALGLLLMAGHAWAAEAQSGTTDLVIQSVDASAFPTVSLRLMMPTQMVAAGDLRPGDFTITENGVAVPAQAVQPLAQVKREPVNVVLVLDTSGSMRGEPIEQAKRAAAGFIDAIGPEDPVAVVVFADTARILHGFTTDKAAVKGSIASAVRAGGETALYDGIYLGAELLGNDAGPNRVVVLLSDGGDTVSARSLNDAATEVAASGVTVHAVTLETPEFNPQSIDLLARNSGGTVLPVRDAAQLQPKFATIAKQLATPFVVTYTSLRPVTKDLEVDVVATSRDLRAAAQTVIANPAFSLAAATTAITDLPAAGLIVPIALAAFLAVALLAFGILSLLKPEANTLEQLQFYEQLQGAGEGFDDAAAYDPESARGRLMALAGTVAAKGGFEGAIRKELEAAGLPLRPVEYMTIHIAVVIGSGLLALLVFGSAIPALLSSVIFALTPVLLLDYLVRKRANQFQEQLPDVLNLLASSLRAGWGLLQAIGIVVQEMTPPARTEFARVVTEARLGIPLEQALDKMGSRLRSSDFQWAVTAIGIQREVGGNLAEVLDTVAATVRERAMLRRQISSLTAEGRLSAGILIGLPIVEAIVLFMLNPTYMMSLTAHPLGVAAALGAVVLLVIGGIWLVSIVRIEV